MVPLILRNGQLALVRRHAEEAAPEECCGILLGVEEPGGRRVAEVRRAANAADRNRGRRYVVKPEDLVAALRDARRKGQEIVGYYHSHPRSSARPSAHDLRHAWPEVSYLIVSLAGGRFAEIRSWRLADAGDTFREETVILEDEREDRDRADRLEADEMRRYGRHLVLPEVGREGQERLKAARVLLVGAGGLGSPAGLYLAAAGVGTLGIVDFDRVDESNLQRQVLYGSSDVGRPKVEAAAERLRQTNPHVVVERHDGRLTAENAGGLVGRYDVVVDGSDNFVARYLVNDACVLAGKPDVWGAVARFEGQVSVFWGARGPCYRCLFPEPPPPHLAPSCAEAGVLGVLPGIIGSLQASETLKLLLEIGDPLIGRFVVFDALRTSFREISLRKSPECPACGPGGRRRLVEERPSICEEAVPEAGLGQSMPGAPDQERAMTTTSDVPFDTSVEELKAWLDEGRELAVLDVREPHEHDLCRIEGAKLVPLRELPQRLDELDRDTLTVVHCHHGPRSSHAVAFLRDQGFARATNLAGGIDAWSLRIDGSVPRY